MLGVTEIAKNLNTKMGGVEVDSDNNKLREGKNGGKMLPLALKASDIILNEDLLPGEQDNDPNSRTPEDDGNTQENNASQGINEDSSATNAAVETDESCSAEQQKSDRNDLHKLNNGVNMTTDNSPLQRVAQDLNSAYSSDEEVFSRKPKPKKAVLFDDDNEFDDGLDDVNLDNRNDRIATDHKQDGNLEYDVSDDEDSDGSYTKKQLTNSDTGHGNIKDSMVDDGMSHGIYEDIFDAEMDEDDVDRDEQVKKNYTTSSGCNVNEKEEDACGDDADDVFDAEESEEEFETSNKKNPKEKKEKPHRMKKADVKQIHSESQRILRESTVRLPYHVPAVKPITHFLSRVPQLNKNKSKESASSKKEPDTDEHKSTEGTSETTPKANGSRCKLKDITPTLSKSKDFIELSDGVSSHSRPVNTGLQKLMERFAKHSSPKLQTNMEKFEPVIKKEVTGENAKEGELNRVSPARHKHVDPLVPEEKVKELKTPGARLQVLKEKLQQKIKVQRAEQRKIQESQRKLDNEELSEGEEEEEEITDEEDSDYELEKWNIEDERKQEEGENKNEEESENEDGHSGSEGDVSDFENDKESVFSDKVTNSNIQDILRNKKVTNDRNSKTADVHKRDISPSDRHSPDTSKGIQYDDRTMDLFGSDSRSRNDTQDSLTNNSEENRASSKSIGENNGRFGGLCLRLDSFEDENTNGYCSYSSHNLTNAFTKIKGNHKIDEHRSPVNISEASQDSIFDRRLSSDFDASNDSSRIPAGQGEGTKRNCSFDSDRKTPELFPSSLLRLQTFDGSRVGKQGDGQTFSAKTPGKLSQLTLPVEDSQDLFYDEDENKTEDDNQSKCASESTQDDFHFTLDEDTQFTQLLDTQGFINSSKKSKKPKTKTMFESNGFNSVDPMEELLGLCSGKFTEPGSTQSNSRDGKEQVEETEDAEEEEENEEEEEEEEENNSEEIDSEVDEKDEEVDNAESESNEELDYEEKLQRKYSRAYEQPKTKMFDRANFLEEEAELSGSDVGSDDDDDGGESGDEYEEEENDEVLPSNKELQKQINKVHMKTLLDEDKAELRLYKEMYLPDGDLYSDGGGRTRNFRWRGIDDSQLNLFDNKALWGDEEGFNLEDASEEEIKKRKERYERETFLREEMNKKKDNDIIMDIDENSQTILNKIKNTSNAAPAGVPASEQKITTPSSTGPTKLVRLPSQKGSFLNRSKQTLSKLSAITANTPNASAATRAFVFQSVSPAGKTTDQGKRVRRSASMLDIPSAKRPKLDRSTSHTPTGSVFSMF